MVNSPRLFTIFLLGCALFGLAATASAQSDSCHIPPGVYCTYTIGGWGADCRGNNPGCVRDTYFSVAFPAGLTIGGTHTIHFTTSAAVNAFLPATGTPGVLTASYIDPTATPAGVFAGQLTAVALAIGFGDAGVPGFGNLRPLVVPRGLHDPNGPFAGWTVEQVFNLANQVLGGNLGALPIGISLSDLNTMLDVINRNFDGGIVSNDSLVEPGCDEVLPVEIASFNAVIEDDRIVLHWRTAAESNVVYFEIHRRDPDSDWMTAGSVSSFGNSATGFSYAFADQQVARGVTYTYRLVVHSLDGSSRMHPTLATASIGTVIVPAEFALLQNYPNPFNPNTTIGFSLPVATAVQLRVFDVTGRAVSELANRDFDSGTHFITFDAGDLSAGVYFYQIQAGEFSAVRKLVLAR